MLVHRLEVVLESLVGWQVVDLLFDALEPLLLRDSLYYRKDMGQLTPDEPSHQAAHPEER